MATTTFQFNINKLNNDFINKLKKLFKDKDIELTVREILPTEKIPLSLDELIDMNENTDFSYPVPHDDFDKIVQQFRTDEQFDVIGEIEKYKTFK